MLNIQVKCISVFILSFFYINISFSQNVDSKEERIQTESDTIKSIFEPKRIQTESYTMKNKINKDSIRSKRKEKVDIFAVSFAGGAVVGAIVANVMDDKKTGGELAGLNIFKDVLEFFGGFFVGFIITAVVFEKIVVNDNAKKSDKINNIIKNFNVSFNKNEFGNKLYLINYNYRFN